MGSWDYKLFDNDDACDLKDDYREQIILGMSDEDAETYIIHEFELSDEENYMLMVAICRDPVEDRKIEPACKRYGVKVKW